MNVEACFSVHIYDPYDDCDQWPEKGIVFSSDAGLSWIERHIKSFVHEQIMASRGLNVRIQLIDTREKFDQYDKSIKGAYLLSPPWNGYSFPMMWPYKIQDHTNEITVVYLVAFTDQFGTRITEHKYKLDRKTVLE